MPAAKKDIDVAFASFLEALAARAIAAEDLADAQATLKTAMADASENATVWDTADAALRLTEQRVAELIRGLVDPVDPDAPPPAA